VVSGVSGVEGVVHIEADINPVLDAINVCTKWWGGVVGTFFLCGLYCIVSWSLVVVFCSCLVCLSVLTRCCRVLVVRSVESVLSRFRLSVGCRLLLLLLFIFGLVSYLVLVFGIMCGGTLSLFRGGSWLVDVGLHRVLSVFVWRFWCLRRVVGVSSMRLVIVCTCC